MIIGLVFLFLCLCLSIMFAVLKFVLKASALVIKTCIRVFVFLAVPILLIVTGLVMFGIL